MIQRMLASNSRWLAFVLLTVTALFWGSNAVIGRGFYMDISPISLAFWRWAVATLMVLSFTWKHLQRDWLRMVKAWPIMLLLSLLGISLFNTLLYTGARTTSAINLGLMQTTLPLMIIVLCFVLYGERITRLQAMGVLCALAGGAITVARGSLNSLLDMQFVPGDLWMLLAMLIYGLYSVLLRERPQIHPLSFLSASFLIGSLIILPFYVWECAVTSTPIILSNGLFGVIIYLAIFPSLLAYLFWNYGVSVIGATRAGMFVSLVPIFATALSLLFLDDPLELFHVIGLVFIVAGIVLANLNDSPRMTN